MKKLTIEHFRSMPWKNGAGTTIEIAVFPEQASMNDFIWRVSRAQVVNDGGFSHFEGIDRSLALLRGNGMRLAIAEQSLQVDAGHPVVCFGGDVATHATLLNGAIDDFNLMTRRAICTHQLKRLVDETRYPLMPDCVLVYCAQGHGYLAQVEVQGEVQVEVQGEVQRNPEYELSSDQALQFDSTDDVANYFLVAHPESIFYTVHIQMNGEYDYLNPTDALG